MRAVDVTARFTAVWLRHDVPNPAACPLKSGLSPRISFIRRDAPAALAMVIPRAKWRRVPKACG